MWNNRFKKKEIAKECLVETTTLQFNGRWIRVEFIRRNFPGNPTPDIGHAQIRDLDKNEIISRCMEGFELHSAFVWGGAVYVFATDYWNIYMCKSFDLSWWSKPMLVLNNHSMNIQHQNNSVCWDGNRFIMAVDLLGGNYNFTVCFAYSYDLQEFHYIPGAVYRADLYTSSPKLYYVDGWYYLIHVRNTDKNCWWNVRYSGKPADMTMEDAAAPNPVVPDNSGCWWFEQFVSRSRNLLVWEDAPHNPILSPNPEHRIQFNTGGTKPECAVGDLSVYERNGITIGDYHGGTQEASTIPTFNRAEFPGTLAEFFKSFYE